MDRKSVSQQNTLENARDPSAGVDGASNSVSNTPSPIQSADREPIDREFTEESSLFLSRGTNWAKSFFPNLRDAAIRWSEDDASSLAASVAYYLALSLFPMMLLLTSGIGLFFEFSNFGRDAEAQILETVEQQTNPLVKQQIEEVLNQLRNQSLVSGPFGILAAILAAIGVFAQIDRGFDRIFRVPPQKSTTMVRTVHRIVKQRWLAFLMLVGLGGAILVLFASTMILTQFRSITQSSLPTLRHVFGWLDTVSTIAMNGLLFGMVYRYLPKKNVHWQDAIRGGLLAALIWELGRTILGVFFIGMRYTSAYGVIGSFIALLLWCYYGISILFFGAEYVQVLEQRRKTKRCSTARTVADDEEDATAKQESNPSMTSQANSITAIADDRGSAEQATLHAPHVQSHSEAGRPLLPPHRAEHLHEPRRTQRDNHD